ncbi:hypothetical protein NB638_09070 [Oxalobacter formigenes]|nr:hypothetical protein NB638_09070 [Oxalobacter formigenes]
MRQSAIIRVVLKCDNNKQTASVREKRTWQEPIKKHKEILQQEKPGSNKKEGRMEREKEIAGAHKKAKRDPASKAARQKQRDGMMERKSNISGAHQKARDARNESMQNN